MPNNALASPPAAPSSATQYLAPREQRPASTARGVHHVALISSDVERTVQFFQDVLGFPLIEMFENRDYEGSTHFFFDIGHGNTLAYFDLPGLGPRARTKRCSVATTTWRSPSSRPTGSTSRRRLDEQHIEYAHVDGSSLYFRGPDGERLELISDPLLEMYGKPVG